MISALLSWGQHSTIYVSVIIIYLKDNTLLIFVVDLSNRLVNTWTEASTSLFAALGLEKGSVPSARGTPRPGRRQRIHKTSWSSKRLQPRYNNDILIKSLERGSQAARPPGRQAGGLAVRRSGGQAARLTRAQRTHMFIRGGLVAETITMFNCCFWWRFYANS